jgi:hypothetical protein
LNSGFSKFTIKRTVNNPVDTDFCCFLYAEMLPVTALAAGAIVEVHVVIADQVQDHLGGLGQCHMTQMNAIQCHVIHGTLTQPMDNQ